MEVPPLFIPQSTADQVLVQHHRPTKREEQAHHPAIHLRHDMNHGSQNEMWGIVVIFNSVLLYYLLKRRPNTTTS